MKNVFIKMVIFSFCSVSCAQPEKDKLIKHLVIEVDTSKNISMKEVPATDLLNYSKFGLLAPQKCDQYYEIKSAYHRTSSSSTIYGYNLVEKASPELIALQKHYLFPKYVPKSFLDTIKTDPDKEFTYTVKDKPMYFKYTVEYYEKLNETGAEQTTTQKNSVATLPVPKDYTVDLFALLSLICG